MFALMLLVGAAAPAPADLYTPLDLARLDGRRLTDRVSDREAGEVATHVTWYTFFGTLASMLAAVAGGYCGAGPNFRLFATTATRGEK